MSKNYEKISAKLLTSITLFICLINVNRNFAQVIPMQPFPSSMGKVLDGTMYINPANLSQNLSVNTYYHGLQTIAVIPYYTEATGQQINAFALENFATGETPLLTVLAEYNKELGMYVKFTPSGSFFPTKNLNIPQYLIGNPYNEQMAFSAYTSAAWVITANKFLYNWNGIDELGYQPVVCVLSDFPNYVWDVNYDVTRKLVQLPASGVPFVSIESVARGISKGMINNMPLSWMKPTFAAGDILEGLVNIMGLEAVHAYQSLQPGGQFTITWEMGQFENVDPYFVGSPKFALRPNAVHGDYYKFDEGKHNSSIMSFWHYAASMGFSAYVDNDNSRPYVTVKPLSYLPFKSSSEVAKILFLALSKDDFKFKSFDYNLVRDKTLEAAYALGYPTGSREWITIHDAWALVGVGEKFSPDPPSSGPSWCSNGGGGDTFYNGAVTFNDTEEVYNNTPIPFSYRKLETCANNSIPSIRTLWVDDNGDSHPFIDADKNSVYDIYNESEHPYISKIGVSVHWATIKAFDFFSHNFGFAGLDGKGTLDIYNKITPTASSDKIYFDTKDAALHYDMDKNNITYSPVSLDFVGKNVAEVIADLKLGDVTGKPEAVAVLKSFSDIMGVAIKNAKRKEDGLVPLWTFGESIFGGNDWLRDFKNPKSKGQPKFYKGDFYDLASSDLEHNSGIINHLSYLMSYGGAGDRDGKPANGYYIVLPIFPEAAEKIIFETIASPSFANIGPSFLSFTIVSQQVAEQIYGKDSQEVASLANALYAVGLLDEPFGGIPQTYPQDNAGIFDPKFVVEPWSAKLAIYKEKIGPLEANVKWSFELFENTVLPPANIYQGSENAMGFDNVLKTFSIDAFLALQANTPYSWRVALGKFDQGFCDEYERELGIPCGLLQDEINQFIPWQSFKTKDKAPDVSGFNNSVKNPWNTKVNWGDVENAEAFQVQIAEATDPKFDAKLLPLDETYDFFSLPNGLTEVNEIQLKKETGYFFRVKAIGPVFDVFGEATSGLWSEVRAFKTDTPGVLLLSPDPDAPVDPFNEIKLEWKKTDGAVSYIVELSEDNKNYTVLSLYETGDHFTIGGATPFALPNPKDQKPLWWRVTPVGPKTDYIIAAEQGKPSSRKFIMDGTKISPVKIISPTGCQSYGSAAMSLNWKAAPGCEKYIYEVVRTDNTVLASGEVMGGNSTSVSVPGAATLPDDIYGGYTWTIKPVGYGMKGPASSAEYSFIQPNIHVKVNVPDINAVEPFKDIKVTWESEWIPNGFVNFKLNSFNNQNVIFFNTDLIIPNQRNLTVPGSFIKEMQDIVITVTSLTKDACNTTPPSGGTVFTTTRQSTKKDPKDPKNPSKDILLCKDKLHYNSSVASSYSLFMRDDITNALQPFCDLDGNGNCTVTWDNNPDIMPASKDLRLGALPFSSNIQFVVRTASNLPPYPKDPYGNPVNPVIEITGPNNFLKVFTFTKTDWMPNHDIVIVPIYSCVDFEQAGASNRMKNGSNSASTIENPADELQNTLILMPNPANTYVDIVLNSGTESIQEIKIVDTIGKEILTLPDMNSRSYRFELGRTMPGQYLVLVKSEKRMYVKKLMVK